MNSLIRFALKYRALVVLVSLGILIYGGYSAANLPIDVFPDLDRPRVTIMTECHGLAAEEVEILVSAPLESALLGASGVQMVRSQSGPGLSILYVDFDWTTDLPSARQVVRERLMAMEQGLPEGVLPHLQPTSSIMGQILLIGMSRMPGPNGGWLAPLDKSGTLTEFVLDRDDAKAVVAFWKPTPRKPGSAGRDSPTDGWQAENLKGAALELSWPGMEGSPVTLQPSDDGPRFAAQDSRLGNLPPDLGQDGVILHITRDGKTKVVPFHPRKQAMELRTLADWVVRLRLLQTPGIAQITVMGGGRKQYQVLLDPEALRRFNVTLEDVETALRKSNINTSGGFAAREGLEQPIRVFGRLGLDGADTIEELKGLPVKPTPHGAIRLEQVAARIVEGAQFKRGDSSINGQPGVAMTVHKQAHVDTRELTSRLLAALEEVERTLPPDIVINPELFQMKNFIDRGIFNVAEALVLGAGLVLIVLFLFLLNFRTTFISLTAIPLSLAITALVFRMVSWITGTELSINVMTLGGIAVAMGELVDDAIVDVENIFRRLRENQTLPEPRASLAVIYDASVEIRSAIVYGTGMVILVFLPLFALSGVEGRLFAPLAIAYIVSILASLLVSLMVTPVLSYYLLPKSKAAHRHDDSPFLRWLKVAMTPLIRLSMARPGWILIVSWLLVVGAAWHITQLGSDFLPPFDEGTVQVNLNLPPGASLEASNQAAGIVDGRFLALKQSPANPDAPIKSFLRMTGRAELDDHAEPVSNTHYYVAINPTSGLSREEVIKLLREDLKGNEAEKIDAAVPHADVEVEQPLAHLISHMLTGVSAQIAIKISGDDLDKLRSLAQNIKSKIASVEGLVEPIVEAQQLTEELQIRLRPEALSRYGLSREYVAHYVELALQGETVSQVIEGQRRFDLLVRFDEPFRTDYTQLKRLRVDIPNQKKSVPLGDLADIRAGLSPNYVKRENGKRILTIRCNVEDRDVGSVAQDIETRIREEVQLPPGYFVELGGQFQAQRHATYVIGGLALVSAFGMFAILYTLFPSWRVVMQVLNALPTAFIGGVLALVLTRQSLTVAALVGFISLGGIAVRNGILLVTHYFHLMRKEGEPFSEEMVLRGSLERLSPVLMTALTAGIALIPLVIGGFQPGREILYPVATVILGGLITSTLCEFLIHPGLFWRFSGHDAVRLSRHGKAHN